MKPSPPGSTFDRAFARTADGTPNVLAKRTTIMGTGLPPYNSTGKPPISIAFVDACATGLTNGFSSFLYPYTNIFTDPYTEDQSYVGWTIDSDADRAYDTAYAFWAAMVNGNTATKARDEAIKVYYNTQFPEEYELDDLAVYGDQNTRLRSVYTGTDAPQTPSTWKRKL